MRKRGVRAVLAGLAAALLALPAAGRQEPVEASGRELVERWFRLLEDLDGSEERRAAFLNVYREDALHIQGPSGAHQRGTTTFWGREKVGMLIDRLQQEWGDHSVRIEVTTAAEVSAALLPETDGPWGGPFVAAEFGLSGTHRETGIRWHVPGAAFFRIAGGQLSRVRIYLGLGEAAEVELQ